MKLSAKDQTTLINLLARYCDDIAEVEKDYKLWVGQTDTRPRVEYFHDAIRTFTLNPSIEEVQERLSVERLTYDLQALRYLSEKPFASLSGSPHLSASTTLVPIMPGLVTTAKKPDRETKEALGEMYKKYALLFAALLKRAAENDYLDRSEIINDEVANIKEVIEQLNKGDMNAIATSAQHLDDTTLKQLLQEFLASSKGKQKAALPALLAKFKATTQRKDRALKALETSFTHYTTTQLAIYENGRDTLKKMVASGLNIVGEFVEASVKAAGQGRGRQ